MKTKKDIDKNLKRLDDNAMKMHKIWHQFYGWLVNHSPTAKLMSGLARHLNQ